jgi:hypothetical protein
MKIISWERREILPPTAVAAQEVAEFCNFLRENE